MTRRKQSDPWAEIPEDIRSKTLEQLRAQHELDSGPESNTERERLLAERDRAQEALLAHSARKNAVLSALVIRLHEAEGEGQ